MESLDGKFEGCGVKYKHTGQVSKLFIGVLPAQDI